ncbi:MAG: bifunctional chorismate mutase/prephenate dehydrogenase [Myxococcaceae bacterium]
MKTSSASDAVQRPLPVLRALLDAVDRDVLDLLARRQALIHEMAEQKALGGRAVHEARHEKAWLTERATRGHELGLPDSLIESLFRTLRLADLDVQAKRRAASRLPADVKTIAVVGGKGAMGRMMSGMFADLGHVVLVADVDTETTPEAAVDAADVVVVSVPIDKTVEVIRKLGPRVKRDALLMDVTSLKEAPTAAMLASTEASVVGTHPMFGPRVHTLQGQRVVICPSRGAPWAEWVRTQFVARGLVVTEATPAQHDRAMAMVQVLTHLQTEVVGLALSRAGLTLQETLPFTSPVYLIELLMVGRHFAQAHELYGQLQMLNPHTPEVLSAFEQATQELLSVIRDKNLSRFREVFAEVRHFLGSFSETALEQSNFLVDRLLERSA